MLLPKHRSTKGFTRKLYFFWHSKSTATILWQHLVSKHLVILQSIAFMYGSIMDIFLHIFLFTFQNCTSTMFDGKITFLYNLHAPSFWRGKDELLGCYLASHKASQNHEMKQQHLFYKRICQSCHG